MSRNCSQIFYGESPISLGIGDDVKIVLSCLEALFLYQKVYKNKIGRKCIKIYVTCTVKDIPKNPTDLKSACLHLSVVTVNNWSIHITVHNSASLNRILKKRNKIKWQKIIAKLLFPAKYTFLPNFINKFPRVKMLFLRMPKF